jgi:glycosyltransferase involved in cell wall biosynthesis
MQTAFVRYWGSHFKTARQVETVILQYRAMMAKGWACHLVVEREPENPEWAEALRTAGVMLRCLTRPRGNFDWSCVRRIRTLCRETGCSVLQCDNMHTSPLLGAFLARVPVRVWCKRSMNAHYEEGREPGWRERLAVSTRLSCRLATCVIALSSAVAEELHALGAPPHRVTVFGNPRPELQMDRALRDPSRNRFHCQEQDVLLVSVGHAVPVKGWDLLVEAFARVSTAAPCARLMLAGSHSDPHETEFYASLCRRIKELGLENRIQFTGRLRDIRPVLAAGDIFVLPSRSEGCCNALLEALEAGLPCVAARVGNVVEAVQDGTNGFIVPRNDITLLAERLLLLVQNQTLRASFAAAASLPGHVLTREQHALQLAELYASLAANPALQYPNTGIEALARPGPAAGRGAGIALETK